MSTGEQHFQCEEVHPIDIVESLAEEREWDFDRLDENQIAMMIKGAWVEHYSVTLALSYNGDSLRLVCAFTIVVPKIHLDRIRTIMALANDKCWAGAFVLWREQKLMGYRYSLNLAGDAQASAAQINDMIRAAVSDCERFYPAFQEVLTGQVKPRIAVESAIGQTYGRA